MIVASVFGEISPKIKMSTVRMPVAIPAPTLPQILIAREVASEDADVFCQGTHPDAIDGN